VKPVHCIFLSCKRGMVDVCGRRRYSGSWYYESSLMVTSVGAEGVVYEVMPPCFLETMLGEPSRCSALSKCERRERRERARSESTSHRVARTTTLRSSLDFKHIFILYRDWPAALEDHARSRFVKKLDGDKLFPTTDCKEKSDLDGTPVMSECWHSNAVLVSSHCSCADRTTPDA
jgi:hypothetical protein